MPKKRDAKYYLSTIIFAVLCGVIIYLQRSDIILSTFTVGGVLVSTSDFFMMIAAGICGYKYGMITFLVILISEFYRLMTNEDSNNLMMMFSLYIYLVIGMIMGFVADRLWFKKKIRIILAGVILVAFLSVSWFFLANYLVPEVFKTYSDISMWNLCLGALPEVFAAIIVVFIFLRLLPVLRI